MEKIKYEMVAQVETTTVLPRTLEVKPETMKLPGADATMYVVYGYDPAKRKIWCATFIDQQEAEAWAHGSKVFGRPVRGAVIAGQENVKLVEAGEEMSDDAVAVGDEGSGPADKPS